jgi:hypothetical protein
MTRPKITCATGRLKSDVDVRVLTCRRLPDTESATSVLTRHLPLGCADFVTELNELQAGWRNDDVMRQVGSVIEDGVDASPRPCA